MAQMAACEPTSPDVQVIIPLVMELKESSLALAYPENYDSTRASHEFSPKTGGTKLI